MKSEKDLHVLGIFDPSPQSIANCLDQIKPEPKIYDDYRKLIESPDIDWVLIASPNNFHKEQAVAALEAGKHVFCQKPMATSFEDCIAIQAANKKSGKFFNLGYTLRYSPHYRKIKHLLEDGAVGKIISMEFNQTLEFNHGGFIMGDWRRLRANSGPFLLEKCSHDIDLVNWMIGSLPKRVASFGGLNFFVPENEYRMERIGKNKEGQTAYRTWLGENPFTSDKDVIDNQIVLLEYENGVRATFHMNANAGIPERRMYILGSEGTIRADVLVGSIETKRIGFDTSTVDESTGGSGGHGGGDDFLVSELAESMLNNVPPTVGSFDGLTSAATCFAIDMAMITGQVVDCTPFWKMIGL